MGPNGLTYDSVDGGNHGNANDGQVHVPTKGLLDEDGSGVHTGLNGRGDRTDTNPVNVSNGDILPPLHSK